MTVGGRSTVIPVERPTVPKAETDSKSSGDVNSLDAIRTSVHDDDGVQRDERDRERLTLRGRRNPAPERR